LQGALDGDLAEFWPLLPGEAGGARTPAQASARPYAVPPGMSTGVQVTAGSGRVTTAARNAGVTATPTPGPVRIHAPNASPPCPLAALGVGVPPPACSAPFPVIV
jgi:hypothetical protein